MPLTIGSQIYEALQKRRMSQRQLAMKLNKSPSLISQWIKGLKNIDAKDLYQIAVITDFPIQFFYPEMIPFNDLEQYGEILAITPAGDYEIITMRRKKTG